MKKAVFLDRDGVINKLIFNPVTEDYESPHFAEDMHLYPGVTESIKQLTDAGYLLFLVSNQPSYAKGKTTIENIFSIHDQMHGLLASQGVQFTEYYYCYHHPESIVPDYPGKCRCRKPSPYFLQEAANKYDLDMVCSWMVGDQDSDVFCGQAGGVKTVLIENEHSARKRGKSQPDYLVRNLEEAIKVILLK
jgi:D-glycero-D-manno-heptose 1,7-bisphosphate phosphatase